MALVWLRSWRGVDSLDEFLGILLVFNNFQYATNVTCDTKAKMTLYKLLTPSN